MVTTPQYNRHNRRKGSPEGFRDFRFSDLDLTQFSTINLEPNLKSG